MNSDEIDELIEQHEQLHAIWLKYDPEDNAVAELHMKTAQALRELKQQGTRKDGLLRAANSLVSAIADGWKIDRTSPEFLNLQAIIKEAEK